MKEALSMETFSEEPDGDISISENLDENGFPSLPLTSESRDEEEADRSIDDDGSFVEDFYHSGTNWSCLMEKESDEREKKKLIQPDLFRMWGLTKPCAALKCSASSPRPKKKMKLEVDWRVRSLEREKPASRGVKTQQKRVCPFCKKIPGTPFTVDAF